MRRLMILFLCLCAFVNFDGLKAQNDSKEWKRWSVGASYFVSWMEHDPFDERWHGSENRTIKYYGFSIDASYRLRLYKLLMFHPSISLTYQRQDDRFEKIWVTGGPNSEEYWAHKDWGIGANIALPVGIHFSAWKLWLDLETGPVFNFLFNEMYQYKYISATWDPEYERKKFGMSWRFGVRATLKPGIFLGVSFDAPMTSLIVPYYEGKTVKPVVFNFSLGYEF